MKFAMKYFDKVSKYAIFLFNAGQQNAPSERIKVSQYVETTPN